jgi:hypothetical protein
LILPKTSLAQNGCLFQSQRIIIFLVLAGLRIRISYLRVRPAFHCNADPDPSLLLGDGNLRPPKTLQVSIVSDHGPSRLYFEPLELYNLDFLMRIRI